MKNTMYKLFAILFTFGVALSSCELDLNTPEIDDQTTQDNALGERAVGDVFGIVNTGTGGKATGDCGNYNFDPTNKTLIVTFDNCTGKDGVTRSGVIHAQFTGIWRQANSSVQITFVNYKRDGNTLSGTINVAYTTGGDIPEFTMLATDMSLTFANGEKTTWESSNTYRWLEGANTPLDRSDDTYSITGATNGTARNENEFSRISTDLVTSPDCKWFTEGTLKLTITGEKTDIYKLTFSEPCGTVSILYNGITIKKNFEE